MLDPARLRAAYEKVRDELLAERTANGHWVGELSSSALATATAVSALAVVKAVTSGRGARVQGSGFRVQQASGAREPPEFDAEGSERLDDLIRRGVAWLVRQQNADGGFGDTDLSHSNIATTYLVVAALHLAEAARRGASGKGVPTQSVGTSELLARANAYLDAKGRLNGLRERYGIDKTFIVPIMTNLALAGLVKWREIDPLPFELACVPQSWYRFVGMPVVSYAIPALVAIGQARYFHAPPRNPLTRLIRWLSIPRSLRVLRRMQPVSGGYLEATPLTSFVVMSLASISKPRPVVAVHATDRNAVIADEVIRAGVEFLTSSIRPDGSWPIDTNLATWNTTLAINALAGAGEDVGALLLAKPRPVVAVHESPPQTSDSVRSSGNADSHPATTGRGFGNVLDWLLSCQHTKRHPFTGANPGGFGWSDLSGAVPDADDTAGAILVLATWRRLLKEDDPELTKIETAISEAGQWLLKLGNRDGGWPTFCRGWGKLPFDRSGSDLTAHVLRAAYSVWPDPFGESSEWGRYLRKHQHPDGSWSPLWFGNQDHPQEDNPVYGTAKVLMAYRDLGLMDSPEAQRGARWLVANQNEDGGWGSGVWGMRNAERNAAAPSSASLNPDFCILNSSVEETALAVEALLAAYPTSHQPPATSHNGAAVARGLAWLIDRVERGEHRQPAPIGFYFAKLWYYERLYPLTFTVAALGRACLAIAPPSQTPDPATITPSDAP